MLPVLKGLISRRVLLNFRTDPDVVRKLLPKPFEPQVVHGSAIVGVCLIRMEELRPSGLPPQVGLASENMAHRVAVRYPENGETKTGVFIWRRETDQRLVQLFGGRLFPGVHHGATFTVRDDPGDAAGAIAMDVKSGDGTTDVAFSAREASSWSTPSRFADLKEACAFFAQGDCGFSCTRDGDAVEGMQLRIANWSARPLTVELQKAAFYLDNPQFPRGSVEFDCGLLMRAVPHEWHELKRVPELESVL